jgi:HEAT repeat protein
MRPRILWGLLLVTGVVLGTALKLRHQSAGSASAASESIASESNGLVAENSTRKQRPSQTVASLPVTPETRQEIIGAEVERIQELGTSEDPAALDELLQALSNSDKEIREAALEAVKQSGNSNAIPALETAVESAADVQEKISILEAIELLRLPAATFDGPPVVLTAEQQKAAEERRARRALRRQEPATKRSAPTAVAAPGPSGTGL